MPVFEVEVSETRTQTFLVQAESAIAAEEAAPKEVEGDTIDTYVKILREVDIDETLARRDEVLEGSE